MNYMNQYKLCMNNKDYNSWEIYETNNLSKVNLNINPLDNKLFSNDVFIFNEKDNVVELIHSTVRSGPPISGVLILSGNKTYGRHNKDKLVTSNNRNQGKLLYKCIPDDSRLPSFLIPYEIKHVGFSKVFKNLYVTFTFDEWTSKHPQGKLDNVIGPVDVLDNFYEYQLYCKSLNASIQKFQKDTLKSIEKATSPGGEGIMETIKQKYPNIEDRTDQRVWHIITIDPQNSQDFDDGFSIINAVGQPDVKQLSIYISNVTLWLDTLNLWESFSRRISTIYLPDKKRPMLPTILSDCLCSLQENVTRVAFVMDIFIKDNSIINIKYCNSFIKVFKNYCYEEPGLLKDKTYVLLFNACTKLSQKLKYINNIKNSHEIVCYLMILMNYYCAKELINYKTGIFRSTIIKREISLPEILPENVSKFIKIWNTASGQYIDGSKIVDTRHELLDMDAYIHITSPIRRLVDLLNIIKFQQITGLIQLSNNVDIFYNKWLAELDYINITMRSIKKVQCDSTLLDLCHNNPDLLEKEYEGYLFDKIIRNDGLFIYIVFLPELKLSSRITMRENFENFICKKFKLFLFNNEEKFKKKIRLHLL